MDLSLSSSCYNHNIKSSSMKSVKTKKTKKTRTWGRVVVGIVKLFSIIRVIQQGVLKQRNFKNLSLGSGCYNHHWIIFDAKNSWRCTKIKALIIFSILAKFKFNLELKFKLHGELKLLFSFPIGGRFTCLLSSFRIAFSILKFSSPSPSSWI